MKRNELASKDFSSGITNIEVKSSTAHGYADQLSRETAVMTNKERKSGLCASADRKCLQRAGPGTV